MIKKSRSSRLTRGLLRGVALLPGSGETVYATTPMQNEFSSPLNTYNGSSEVDAVVSIRHLRQTMPDVKWVSLIVDWFGDDLRIGSCTFKPKSESTTVNTTPYDWVVNGINRTSAGVPSTVDGNLAFGGTPSDRSVIELIRHMRSSGLKVMFYPFILMDIQETQELPDPSGSGFQPDFPWRGRIRPTDAQAGTGTVATQITSLFGTCTPAHFTTNNAAKTVNYTGPAEWGLRRMVLHYAKLCSMAGGVDAFCISSELVGITKARSATVTFPGVTALVNLANDVRTILGDDVLISYASDWSEFMPVNYTSSGFNSIFHLDPLWSSANIDFIGIDNYIPLSDWRGTPLAIDDALYANIYDQSYLKSQIEGGEKYDYYYNGMIDRDAQTRTSISEWRYRDKDHKSWWLNSHYNIINGVTQSVPTAYVPQLKPLAYTEYGCAAVDKGTNQPNSFSDIHSSESSAPYYSTGERDDRMQQTYYEAMTTYWDAGSGHNPTSTLTGKPMLDTDMMFAWAWDARPWPTFPRLPGVWSDGVNYDAGHWLQGRQWIET